MARKAAQPATAIRIDRLLVYLRFARTRSAADALIKAHALRRNRKHVQRGAELACIGDVLTIAQGENVQVIELLAIPDRRGSPALARSHYRRLDLSGEVDAGDLDRKGQMPIAASPCAAGQRPDQSEHRF